MVSIETQEYIKNLVWFVKNGTAQKGGLENTTTHSVEYEYFEYGNRINFMGNSDFVHNNKLFTSDGFSKLSPWKDQDKDISPVQFPSFSFSKKTKYIIWKFDIELIYEINLVRKALSSSSLLLSS